MPTIEVFIMRKQALITMFNRLPDDAYDITVIGKENQSISFSLPSPDSLRNVIGEYHLSTPCEVQMLTKGEVRVNLHHTTIIPRKMMG